ncbi:MAG: amino acid permease, partial [Calditrichia bacterium]
LYHAYHPLAGFLFGWSAFVVTYTGSIATIAVGFGHYFVTLLPSSINHLQFILPLFKIEVNTVKLTAAAVTILFTWLNVRGVRTGARWQSFFTFFGVLVLLLFILAAFGFGEGNWGNFNPVFPESLNSALLRGMGVALIGVYFTYSGWTVIPYLAGEVRDAQKSIPRAIIFGVLTVLLLYLLINTVYVYALPLPEMEGVVDIGHRSLTVLLGEKWSILVTLMVLLAVLSSLNATVMSGARIYFAMSRKGRFFRMAGVLHHRYRTPANALWLQLFWSILLIVSGTFNQLLTYTVFVMLCFAILSGISLFFLRRKGENLPVYRAWGYPVTPALFITILFWILLNTLRQYPVQALFGLGVVLAGIPFYYYFSWRNQASGAGK